MIRTSDYMRCKSFVRRFVSRRTLLEGLAEESSELTKAALKMIRAEELADDNPTPVSREKAEANLIEEITHVMIVLDALGYSGKFRMYSGSEYWIRWVERIKDRLYLKGAKNAE